MGVFTADTPGQVVPVEDKTEEEDHLSKKKKMFTRTLLVVMALMLHDAQGSKIAMATRSGKVAHRAIQKILDPRNIETSKVAYEKMKSGYQFFQRIKEIIKKKKQDNLQSEDTHTSDLEMLNKQITTCGPDTKTHQEKCYSPCIKKKTDYHWCYTSSEHRASQWMPCTCTIKKAILEYLDVSRQNILTIPSTPWTYLEITMVAIASGLGALLTLCGSIAGFAYYRRNQEFPLQGNVFPNPIFVPENGQ